MTIYVDDSRTGGTDAGTSWTNAYLTIAQAISEIPAASEKVLIASGHTDTGVGGSWGANKADPPIIISTNVSNDAYLKGASIISTGVLAWSGSHETHGMTLRTASNTSGDLTLSGSVGDVAKFFDCEIGWGDDFNLGHLKAQIEFNDVVWNHLASTSEQAQVGALADGGFIICRRLSFIGSSGAEALFGIFQQGVRIEIFDSDLSGWGAKDFGVMLEGAAAYIRDCKLPTGGLAPASIADTAKFLSERSSPSGTDTPLGLTLYKDRFGTVESVLTPDRTGGADDGENGLISWEMKSSSECRIRVHPLRSPPIAAYVAGGSSITVTLNLAHTNKGGGGAGSRFTDEEFWIELSGPDTDAGAQGFDESTRPGHSPTLPYGDPQTAAVEASDTGAAAWNGSGVADEESRSITFTPNYAGPVIVRACLAKPSLTAVYIDPKLLIT